MKRSLPSDVLLDDTPFGAHLVVDLVEPLKFGLLPLVVVEFWVQKVDPLFSAFDFSSAEASLPENLRNVFPFLGDIEGIEGSE